MLCLSLCALLLPACRQQAGVRSVEAQSPDGLWLAVARTGQASWFARGSQETTVYLQRRSDHSNPVDSLWRSQPWLPLTIVRLTHPAPTPSGEALVQLRWLTPTHLEVAYLGHARLDYHLPNCSGIHVLVEPLGDEGPGPAH